MILSRAKPAIKDDKAEKEKSGSAKKQVPTIEQFLEKRDYTGPCPSVNINSQAIYITYILGGYLATYVSVCCIKLWEREDSQPTPSMCIYYGKKSLSFQTGNFLYIGWC